MVADYKAWQVLVADHSPTMGLLIKKCLVRLGLKEANITVARDGNQAMMFTELKPFELVTSGQHMQVKNGLQLLDSLQGGGGTRFLMISSDESPQMLADLMSRGASGFLKKPFNVNDLEETLRRLAGAAAREFVVLKDHEKSMAKKPLIDEAAQEGVEAGGIPAAVRHAFVESAVESLGQYMVNARPNLEIDPQSVTAELVSSIEISDPKMGVKLNVVLGFPKAIACTIYETLFGEVDLEMVAGVVGELGNILAGSVKPKLAGCAGDLYPLAHPDKELPEAGSELALTLGFPQSEWNPQEHPAQLNGAPGFTVPFALDDGQIILKVEVHPA